MTTIFLSFGRPIANVTTTLDVVLGRGRLFQFPLKLNTSRFWWLWWLFELCAHTGTCYKSQTGYSHRQPPPRQSSCNTQRVSCVFQCECNALLSSRVILLLKNQLLHLPRFGSHTLPCKYYNQANRCVQQPKSASWLIGLAEKRVFHPSSCLFRCWCGQARNPFWLVFFFSVELTYTHCVTAPNLLLASHTSIFPRTFDPTYTRR